MKKNKAKTKAKVNEKYQELARYIIATNIFWHNQLKMKQKAKKIKI